MQVIVFQLFAGIEAAIPACKRKNPTGPGETGSPGTNLRTTMGTKDEGGCPTLVEVRLHRSESTYGILAGMDARGPREGEVDAEDLDLVERARRGEAGAYDALVQAHIRQVWRVVWRILRHREDTEDVVQEVFLAAHRALDTFRGESRLSTWLHRIAVNRALNHRELAAEKLRRASEPLEPERDRDDAESPGKGEWPSPAASPFMELEMKELSRRLAECLEKLPVAWRAVFALRTGESLSYDEIAAAVGTAVGTVRSRLARARMALRRCVEGEGA